MQYKYFRQLVFRGAGPPETQGPDPVPSLVKHPDTRKVHLQ